MSLTAAVPTSETTSRAPLPLDLDTALTAQSATRAATNRANAEHSTGPRTPEGKAKMRFNALQHGLYSASVVLPTEDNESYLSLGRDLDAQYGPENDDERALLETLCETQWRLGRVVSLETAILAIGTADHLHQMDEKFSGLDDLTRETLAQAAGYLANARTLDQLSRHEARLYRLLDRTRRDLLARIAQRSPRAASHSAGSVPQTRSQSLPPAGSVPIVSPNTAPKASATLAPSPSDMPKFTGPLREEHRRQWLRNQAKKNR